MTDEDRARTTLTDAQLDRLPKYARQEIDRLRRDLAYERRRLASVGDPDAATTYPHIQVDPYHTQPIAFAGDVGLICRFGAQWRDEIKIRFAELAGEPVLEVNAGESMTVRPWAGNVVYIRPDRLHGRRG